MTEIIFHLRGDVIYRCVVRQIAHANVSRFPRALDEMLRTRNQAVRGDRIVARRIDAERTHKIRVAHSRRADGVKRRGRFQARKQRGRGRSQAVAGNQQLAVDVLQSRQQRTLHFRERVPKAVKHFALAIPIHQRRVHVVEQIRGIVLVRSSERHHRQLLARVGIVMNRQEAVGAALLFVSLALEKLHRRETKVVQLARHRGLVSRYASKHIQPHSSASDLRRPVGKLLRSFAG